jgi:hypothetical protein
MRLIFAFFAEQIPLWIWLAAVTLFLALYFILFKLLGIDSFVLNLGEPKNGDVTGAYELRWRMLWGLSSLSVVLIALANAIWSAALVIRHPIGRSPYTWMLIGICIAGAVWLSANQDYGGAASDELLTHYSATSDIPVNTIAEILVASVLGVVVLIAAALLTITLRSTTPDAQEVIQKYHNLRKSLMGSTALLVVLVVETYFLFRMATTGLDPDVAGVISTTLTVGGSTSYTILLMVLYGPVALTVETWSRSTAKKEVHTPDVTKVREWLQKRGIYSSPTRVMSQFLMASSPALVGVILDLLPKLF